MEEAVAAIADGRIDVRPWHGAPIRLEGLAEALQQMNDPAAPVRTVVDPRQR